jgi:hypothetical protein
MGDLLVLLPARLASIGSVPQRGAKDHRGQAYRLEPCKSVSEGLLV